MGRDLMWRAQVEDSPAAGFPVPQVDSSRPHSARMFLGRVVRFLAAEAGIRQFLDIGTGLPTENNVHEVAQAAARLRSCEPSLAG
jgi:hypothetical protein